MKTLLALFVFLLSVGTLHAQRPLTYAEKQIGFVLPIDPDSTGQLIQHQGYVLKFNRRYNLADWVSYVLSRDEINGATARIGSTFAPDPLLPDSPVPADYVTKKGQEPFDRGHQAPAGDFRFSRQMMSETFYMSNMAPQRPGFNRGIWKKLETQVRDWANVTDGLYVVTGPVLGGLLPTIGKKHRVAVPESFYKIALHIDTANGQATYRLIGFLLPNKDSNRPLTDYVFPVTYIEEVTGLTFWPLLPTAVGQTLKNSAKANTVSDWFGVLR